MDDDDATHVVLGEKKRVNGFRESTLAPQFGGPPSACCLGKTTRENEDLASVTHKRRNKNTTCSPLRLFKTVMLRKDISRDDDNDILAKASSTFKPSTHENFLPPECSPSQAAILAVERDWSIDLHTDSPALTLKALAAGAVLGVFCNFLALYYNLKAGVIPSLNILSGLGGFLLMKLLLRLRVVRGAFTPQENAVVQTVAVACYSVSSTGIGFGAGYLAMSHNAYLDMGGSAFPGNRESDTLDLTWPRNVLWCFSLVYFGFFLAFPLRDYIILKQKLPFPSGTVTAYVIKNMHSRKTNTSSSFATMAKFFSLAFCSGLLLWVYDGLEEFPIFGYYAMDMYQWSVDFDIGSVGIGAILPLQINLSMLLGSILTYGVLQPYIVNYQNGPDKWVDLDHLPGNSEYLGLQCYAIFSGLAIMVVTGVYTILVLLYTLYRDFRRSKASVKSDGAPTPEAAAAAATIDDQRTAILTEHFRQSRIPTWFPYVGYTVVSTMTVVLLHLQFKVHWYQTLIAVIVVPVFAFSNIQGMGRTDWDTSSSYGKLMMFPFGAWNYGQSILPSLALCSVTISGCSSAASLLQDFKTAYLVGAPPNSMFLGQLFGASLGCLITPSLFLLLSSTFTVPNSHSGAFIQGRYGTIYRTLAAIATGSGFSALPSKNTPFVLRGAPVVNITCTALLFSENVAWIAFGFLLLALVCLILESVLAPKYARFVPNASGMSIGILVGPFVSLEFCLGGVMAWWWTRWNPRASAKLPYIASGCVAGSGIAVVARCFLSLINVQSPVTLNFSDKAQTLAPGQWVGVVVFIVIFLIVLLCGGWYWNQCDEVDDSKESTGIDDATEAELSSSFKTTEGPHHIQKTARASCTD